MSTAAQIKANRRNAKRSTGPATAEGKAAASRNRLEHGFCGIFRILPFENAAQYEALLNALREEYQPATPTEYILVERMAQHHWLAQRAQFLQASLFSEAHLDDCRQKLLALYLRYQTSNDRAFSKCLADLQKFRTEKRKTEIGFEREKQRAAEEVRRQEAHQTRTRIATARSRHAEFTFDLQQIIEASFSGCAEIPLDALKQFLARSIEQFAAELNTNPALSKALQAA